jgi:hypothetical protein
VVPFARRVRTIRMCSLDARGEGPIQATPHEGKRNKLGKMGRESIQRPSCSQNAHGETVFVRCAQ